MTAHIVPDARSYGTGNLPTWAGDPAACDNLAEHGSCEALSGPWATRAPRPFAAPVFVTYQPF